VSDPTGTRPNRRQFLRRTARAAAGGAVAALALLLGRRDTGEGDCAGHACPGCADLKRCPLPQARRARTRRERRHDA
jgi:hypothetical protein